MLSLEERQNIKRLMQREIIPAIGCTEPIAVALCTAKATEILGEKPEKIELLLSANIIKNAMGVGIPGTGMIGLPISTALGALIGKSEYGLEVLQDLKPDDVEHGKAFINEQRIKIDLKKDIEDKLYIEVRCHAHNNTATAIIRGSHTEFTYLAHNGDVIFESNRQTASHEAEEETLRLSFQKVYAYAAESPIEELQFVLEAAQMNKKAYEASRTQNFGHNVSKALQSDKGRLIFGNNMLSQVLTATTGACDLRMDGGMVPVMSNSGSGNQGITATVPVLTYAENLKSSQEETVRALTLSSLTTIYIKQHLGRLSGLCGVVVAATGSSCGITYLLGGTYEQITFAAKNMIANITGMICDGAKPSCSLKAATGISTASLSALLAMENRVVSSQEGIVDDDLDKTIQNLALIGNKGMSETDKIVLDIMINK